MFHDETAKGRTLRVRQKGKICELMGAVDRSRPIDPTVNCAPKTASRLLTVLRNDYMVKRRVKASIGRILWRRASDASGIIVPVILRMKSRHDVGTATVFAQSPPFERSAIRGRDHE